MNLFGYSKNNSYLWGMKKNEILEEVKRLHDKYEDLVWYARSRPEHTNIPGVKENRERIENLYTEEVNDFWNGGSPDWTHGFNSGMLAGMRYILEMESIDKETADELFPSLDT